MMRKAGYAALVVTLGAALALTGCANVPSAQSLEKVAKPKIGVLLPSEDTAQRWDQVDSSLLDNLIKGNDYAFIPNIENEADEPAAAAKVATEIIDDGSKVLVYAAANEATEKAIVDTAKARGIPTVSYEWAGTGGMADYTVATDYRKLGELQGRGIIRGVRAKPGAKVVELQGGASGEAAAELAAGQRNVLGTRYSTNNYQLVAREQVNSPADASVALIRALDANGGQIDGVLAPNDQIAEAALEVLRQRGLAGKVTVTGNGASPTALKAVLRGEQFMTAYTRPADQAEMVAKLAKALATGDQATVDQLAPPAPPGKPRTVRVAPVFLTLGNFNQAFNDGIADSDDVCEGEFQTRCNQLSVP